MFVFWPVFLWTAFYVGYLFSGANGPWQTNAGLWLAGVIAFGLLGCLAKLVWRLTARPSHRPIR